MLAPSAWWPQPSRLRLRPRAAPLEAFTAVGRLTKNAWLGMTGASALFLLLIPLFGLLANPTFGLVLSFQGPRSSMTLFWLAGLVATLSTWSTSAPRSSGCSGGTSAGDHWSVLGTLTPEPALARLDLLASPVAAALKGWDPAEAAQVGVVEIDPALADTAGSAPPTARRWTGSTNCVVVAGRRGDAVRYAACLVLATTRAASRSCGGGWTRARRLFAPKRRGGTDRHGVRGSPRSACPTAGRYWSTPPPWRSRLRWSSGAARGCPKLALPGAVLAALPGAGGRRGVGPAGLRRAPR